MCKGPGARMSLNSQGIKNSVCLESSEYNWETRARRVVWDRLRMGCAWISGFRGIVKARKARGRFTKGLRRFYYTLQQSFWWCCGKLVVEETSQEACRRHYRHWGLGSWWWPCRRREVSGFWIYFGHKSQQIFLMSCMNGWEKEENESLELKGKIKAKDIRRCP